MLHSSCGTVSATIATPCDECHPDSYPTHAHRSLSLPLPHPFLTLSFAAAKGFRKQCCGNSSESSTRKTRYGRQWADQSGLATDSSVFALVRLHESTAVPQSYCHRKVYDYVLDQTPLQHNDLVIHPNLKRNGIWTEFFSRASRAQSTPECVKYRVYGVDFAACG